MQICEEYERATEPVQTQPTLPRPRGPISTYVIDMLASPTLAPPRGVAR